jgi:hypothetical protein
VIGSRTGTYHPQSIAIQKASDAHSSSSRSICFALPLWLLIAASGANDGIVVGYARRWTREHGRQLFIKRSNEAFETPTPNSFVLPDGRTVKIRSMLVRPQNFTCWGLSTLKALPPNYIRI